MRTFAQGEHHRAMRGKQTEAGMSSQDADDEHANAALASMKEGRQPGRPSRDGVRDTAHSPDPVRIEVLHEVLLLLLLLVLVLFRALVLLLSV